jgi:hypothetical protein
MASGEMTLAEFVAFLSAASANLVAQSVDGSIHFVCMHWRHMGKMLEARAANYGPTNQLKVIRIKNLRDLIEVQIADQRSHREMIVSRLGEPSKRRRG